MSRRGAAFLVILGAFFLSTVGVYIRSVEHAGGFHILFYRSLSLCLCVALIVSVRRKLSPMAVFGSIDRQDMLLGFLLSLSFTFFVFAVLNTSIASALFIMTSAPLIAATAAWVMIGERPHPFTWVAMLLAGGGVFLMIGDGISTGRTLGNLFALAAGTSFALMLVLTRRGRKTDILGGTLVAGILSGTYGVVLSVVGSDGLAIPLRELLLILAMGAFAIGIGIACITWGAPYLPAAEVSVLVLVESVLGPVWVWLLGFEKVTKLELVGGAIVFAAVIALAMLTSRSPSSG